jgi:hypothetical protein
MTRSLRVSHASMLRRDPELARGVARLVAEAAGVAGADERAPSEVPFALGDLRLPSRVVKRVDLALLDAGDDPTAIEQLPAAVARAGRPIGAVVRARGPRNALVGHAAQLVRAGAQLVWIEGDAAAALALSDRVRNELGVATAVAATDGQTIDADAAIAAGRADLVAG